MWVWQRKNFPNTDLYTPLLWLMKVYLIFPHSISTILHRRDFCTSPPTSLLLLLISSHSYSSFPQRMKFWVDKELRKPNYHPAVQGGGILTLKMAFMGKLNKVKNNGTVQSIPPWTKRHCHLGTPLIGFVWCNPGILQEADLLREAVLSFLLFSFWFPSH